MPRYVKLPHAPGHPEVSIWARICTPRNPLAEVVDPRFPTILFCHPFWLDGFFSYPQMDDPLLNQNFNLVALDLRGHGRTQVKGYNADSTFDFWKGAEDHHMAMLELGAKNYHVLGMSTGMHIAVRICLTYPDAVDSVICTAPPPRIEQEFTSLAFKDCQETLATASRIEDLAPLDRLTEGVFEQGAGNFMNEDLQNLLESYRLQARERLFRGKLEDATRHIFDPIINMKKVGSADAITIKCPITVLQGAGDQFGNQDSHLFMTWMNANPRRQNGELPNGRVIKIQGVPHWMTLTCPQTVNAIIVDLFQWAVREKEFQSMLVADVVPFVARRPSSPIDLSRFVHPADQPSEVSMVDMLGSTKSHRSLGMLSTIPQGEVAGLTLEVEYR